MRGARAYLWFCLAASIVFGGAYLFAPAAVSARMGIQNVTPAGLTDLRATYAGFQLGLAVLLGWCLRDPARHAAGLVAFACVVGGLGATRLLGLTVDGFSPEMAAATAIEAILAVAALSILRQTS